MKKTIFAACLAFCLLSAGCGSVSTDSSETSTPTTTAAPETTAVSTTETTATAAEAAAPTTAEANAEPTSAAAPESETQSSADRTAPTTEQAQELIRALNMAERLAGGGLQYDPNTVYTFNGTAYYKVTSADFANTSEIISYENRYLTQDIIADRYSSIIDGDSPVYIDIDDELCMKDSAKGFYIFSEAGLTIEKSFEEGCSLLAEYDNFGAKETADIRIVNENGTWKICGISLGS